MGLWLLLSGLATGIAAMLRGGPSGSEPATATPGALRAILDRWARGRAIPIGVLLAWVKIESDFNSAEYNPERGVMQRWACEIAGNPGKWGANPDFGKAQRVCEALRSGRMTAAQIAAEDASLPSRERLWTFGSVGLMQVSRIASAEAGYAAALPNEGMFEPATNVRYGTAVINRKRAGMFPGERGALSIEKWSLVRAAYVMGVAGAKRNPAGAREKQEKFFAALAAVRPRPAV
jgi:hypothetical protein